MMVRVGGLEKLCLRYGFFGLSGCGFLAVL